MLDLIKEVLVSAKELELKQREDIIVRMNEIKEEEKQIVFCELDNQLTDINQRISSLTHGFFKRMFNSGKIKKLYNEYVDLSRIKNEKIVKFNNERNCLLDKLFDLSHDDILIRNEIERIKHAKSLEELGLTEEMALKLIKEHFENDDFAVIKAVFSNIKNNNNLLTKEDILRNMQELYKVNISSFVTAMKKVVPGDFVSVLLDVGVVIDENKVEFLNELTSYTLKPSGNILDVISCLDRVDDLDSYYYDEVKNTLSRIKDFNYSSSYLSYIMSLSALVSIAKNNNLEKKNKNK